MEAKTSYSKNKKVKSGTKRTNENESEDLTSSQPEEQPTSAGKKRRRDLECLSLSVSDSDLEDYGNSEDECNVDEDYPFIVDEETESPDEILLSSASSTLSSVCISEDEVECVLAEKREDKKREKKDTKRKRQNGRDKVFSDHKDNNRNGKKLIHLDSDSDDEVTDDGSEAHVVCFICGKYNTKKKFYLWISCTLCKNWFHKDCTDLWRKKIKDIERDNFVCRYH
ncbi:uncharacterized protein C01G6.5-like [Panonychus citri]|uniref:uncharacterized protein C01G6.5-like n=1 Tax=Panonychus citri TaxID=50023 RepID=UPI002307547B|nr:uncharacterized protein C01G6.5-like [Panonychus citri]